MGYGGGSGGGGAGWRGLTKCIMVYMCMIMVYMCMLKWWLVLFRIAFRGTEVLLDCFWTYLVAIKAGALHHKDRLHRTLNRPTSHLIWFYLFLISFYKSRIPYRNSKLTRLLQVRRKLYKRFNFLHRYRNAANVHVYPYVIIVACLGVYERWLSLKGHQQQ